MATATKERPAKSAPVQEQADAKTVFALTEHLQETGTPPETLAILHEFARTHKKATAEDALEHLKEEGITTGTIKKAGQWLFGDDYIMQSGLEQPSKSMKDQALEIVNLKRQLAETQATCSRLQVELRVERRRTERQLEELSPERTANLGKEDLKKRLLDAETKLREKGEGPTVTPITGQPRTILGTGVASPATEDTPAIAGYKNAPIK